MLRNHGLLSVGATIPAALRRLYMLERACEVEIIARGLDEEPAPIEDDVVQQLRRARQGAARLARVRHDRLEGRPSPDRRQGQRLAAIEAGPKLLIAGAR